MNRRIRRRFMSVGLAVTLALFGLALPTPTQAGVVVNTSVPFFANVFIPCVPEFAQISGDLHVLITSEVDNNGGTHFHSHFQPQGVSGVGLVTGDKYQGTGVTQTMINSPDGPPFERTFVNNFRIIGQGPGNNFLVHTTFHVTVDANGVVTATVLNTSVDCK